MLIAAVLLALVAGAQVPLAARAAVLQGSTVAASRELDIMQQLLAGYNTNANNALLKVTTESITMRYGVDKVHIVYTAQDGQGGDITSTAALLVPKGMPQSAWAKAPTVLYHHRGGAGLSQALQDEIPTAQPLSLLSTLALPYVLIYGFWASSGVVVVMPDGENLGQAAGASQQSPFLRPLNQPGSYSNNALAALAATREYLDGENYMPSGRLHIVGGYEGAFATLAVHRALEAAAGSSDGTASGFRLLSSHPSTGPLNLAVAERAYAASNWTAPFVANLGSWYMPMWGAGAVAYNSNWNMGNLFKAFRSALATALSQDPIFRPDARPVEVAQWFNNVPAPMSFNQSYFDTSTSTTTGWLRTLMHTSNPLFDDSTQTASWNPRAAVFACGDPQVRGSCCRSSCLSFCLVWLIRPPCAHSTPALVLPAQYTFCTTMGNDLCRMKLPRTAQCRRPWPDCRPQETPRMLTRPLPARSRWSLWAADMPGQHSCAQFSRRS